MTEHEAELLNRIIRTHGPIAEKLIPILQDIQKHYGWLPEGALLLTADALGVPAAQVFSVAAFYSGFALSPQGRTRIEVCHGTACHVRGSGRVHERFGAELKIHDGETTADGSFSLHKVRCLGCCALAPVVRINGAIIPAASPQQVRSLVERYR